MFNNGETGFILCAELDFVNLVLLTQFTRNRLVFGLNLQLRFGQQWNPSQAIELFEFCGQRGFGSNIDWELGNGNISTIFKVSLTQPTLRGRLG